MAGLVSAGVICEIMNEDGTMARVPDLISFCAEHGLKMLTVASLIRYRLQHERYIQRVAESILPTQYGDFRMIAYESEMDGTESHVALVYGGQIDSQSSHQTSGDPVLVRVHTHCLTGEVFGATLCDCRALLDNSLRMIAEAGQGALIYLHNGARGFGIDRSGIASSGEMAPNRLVLHREPHRDQRTDELSQERMQRARRTLRQIGLGSQILSDLGIQRIRLLTNTPTHIPALQGFGIEIVEQVRIPLGASAAAVSTSR
jgi:3,4-dihydroxy 2-butanone 4-phosphate synthase/GTP cyclohydrolase II